MICTLNPAVKRNYFRTSIQCTNIKIPTTISPLFKSKYVSSLLGIPKLDTEQPSDWQ